VPAGRASPYNSNHVCHTGSGACSSEPVPSRPRHRDTAGPNYPHIPPLSRLPEQRPHHLTFHTLDRPQRLWEDISSHFSKRQSIIAFPLHWLTAAQFERGTKAADTHTSQTPIAVECSLPVGAVAKSDEYRSLNDPTNQVHKKFLLIDTPGHGKLRHHALENITNPQNLKGLIFLVDAATLSAGDEGLRQTADYLHDVLLLLQKRVTGSKAAKVLKEIPVLIAANKADLFTALPAALVKSSLEAEITKVRTSRSKGLLDSGIGMGDAEDEKDDWLGEMGSTEFKFSQMEEFDVSVEVSGGNIVGGEGPMVDKWWRWISERL
jgi:signal recognition particle receptor subunit beta